MRVAVAIIRDAEERILITRRSLDVSHGGYWEFPGGKLEEEEPASSALVREIKEEVGLDILAYDFLGEVSYSYNQRDIHLLVYLVHKFQGQAARLEGQMDLRWVGLAELGQFQFPEANVEIIRMLGSHFKYGSV